MEEAQVGNVEEKSTPESFISDDADNFFDALDSEVNGLIIDEETNETSELQTQSDNTQTEQDGNEARPEDVETLKKRYSDSSAEGKRLNKRLTDLEPYLPILDEMRKDPNLVTHVRDYFKGGGQTPESMVDKLELGEDFIFDPDDAVGNPKSDSAKVLNATIDGVVQRRLTNELAKQKDEFRLDKSVSEFRNKYDMNDSEWNEFKSFAENQSLSLDDIYYLKNRGATVKPSSGRVTGRKVQQRPKSLATSGSTKVETSEEAQIFDAILGIDKQLENAFG